VRWLPISRCTTQQTSLPCPKHEQRGTAADLLCPVRSPRVAARVAAPVPLPLSLSPTVYLYSTTHCGYAASCPTTRIVASSFLTSCFETMHTKRCFQPAASVNA